MFLLVHALRVVRQVRGHHGGDVEDELGDAVAPRVGELAVHVGRPVESLGVEAGALEGDFGAEAGQEVVVILTARDVGEDLGFLRLPFAQVDDADFVTVDGVVTVKGADCSPRGVVVG